MFPRLCTFTLQSSVLLSCHKHSGIINEIPFTPVNAEEGIYGLTYDAGLTHEAGVVTATIRLKTFNTTTETPNFEIYVEGSPLEGIHFSEVDGLTFKKVMDKVDSIDFRAGLIEEDILHIDQQLQDMNTRIVYVEEDDSIDERVYNNENDIQLLEREIERIDTELADLRVEIDNIEVVEGGGGGGTGELDTGWRVWIPKGYQNTRYLAEIYVRRIGNTVEFFGRITSRADRESTNIYSEIIYYSGKWRVHEKLPELFWIREDGVDIAGKLYTTNNAGGIEDETSSFAFQENRLVVRVRGGADGNLNVRYLTDRPFTDEYMDLPLADFN